MKDCYYHQNQTKLFLYEYTPINNFIISYTLGFQNLKIFNTIILTFMKANLFYVFTFFTLFVSCKKAQEVPNPENDNTVQDVQYVRTKTYTADDPNTNDYFLFEYDNQQRITKLTQFDHGSILYSFTVVYGKDTIKKIHNMIVDTATQLYFPDCNGRITRSVSNNQETLYTYNIEGYLTNRITKTDSTIFEYTDGNMTQTSSFSRDTKNQLSSTTYTYTTYIDKAHIMDPLSTGLLQESFGKKCKNLINTYTVGNQLMTYTYEFDSNGLPIGLTQNGSQPGSMQRNEFEVR